MSIPFSSSTSTSARNAINPLATLPGALSPAAQSEQQSSFYLHLLEQATACYQALADFRKRRRRAVNFYRGRQWSDSVTVCGRTMSEEEYLTRQGRAPLKQNLIRPPLRNLIGQYRSNETKSMVYARNRSDQQAGEMMSAALESVLDANAFRTRDARALEEFLISGCCIYQTSFSFCAERQRAIPQFRRVNPERFFVNPDFEDEDGQDVRLVGQISDLPFEQVVALYARTPADEVRLRQLYPQAATVFSGGEPVSTAQKNLQSIGSPTSDGLNRQCRVVEVWQQQSSWLLYCHDFLDGSYQLRPVTDLPVLEAENERRRLLSSSFKSVPLIVWQSRYAARWHCYHLTPNGQLLYQAVSPYRHGSHPFVFTFYPMVNGECWGLVEDLIDQQKLINRNMVMLDFMNAASAKGVLLVPEECIPDDLSLEDIATEWARYNGVIKIKAKAGAQIPHQITANAVGPGLQNMLELQMQMIQDIGGVSNASQGKTAAAGTPGSLYAQESQNSAVNTLDYVATFNRFVQLRDKRLIQLIAQFYTSRQFISLTGAKAGQVVQYDPARIADVDFSNAIVQTADSPAFRSLMDDTLMNLLQQNLIPVQVFLENCSLPFAR